MSNCDRLTAGLTKQARTIPEQIQRNHTRACSELKPLLDAI